MTLSLNAAHPTSLIVFSIVFVIYIYELSGLQFIFLGVLIRQPHPKSQWSEVVINAFTYLILQSGRICSSNYITLCGLRKYNCRRRRNNDKIGIMYNMCTLLKRRVVVVSQPVVKSFSATITCDSRGFLVKLLAKVIKHI
jgi:hypothetical protein